MPGSREEDFYRTYGCTLHKDPWPKGHESYNFGRPFLGHHFYTLSLSDLCLGALKKIFKQNNAFSLYGLYDHALAQEPLP